MKIAFATISDVRNIRRGSGTPYYLWKELQRQGARVHLVGPLHLPLPLLTRFFKWWSTRTGKKYFSYRDPFIGRVMGRQVKHLLSGTDYDVLLTNDYCIAGYTYIQKPIVLYTDSMFPVNYLENMHPWLANLSTASVVFCHETTRKGLRRASTVLFASHYAAEEASKYMPTKRDRFKVLPYGANINPPDPFVPKSIELVDKNKQLDLLFIGKDWILKGGDIAVNVVKRLRAQGIPGVLHIVGVGLASTNYKNQENYLRFYGLLNKDDTDDRKQLEGLFGTCSVLLVPSKAEGYGLVFVEAAAFGMPCLAYSTIGVMTAVNPGQSGVLFDLSNNEDAFVEQINFWLRHPDAYHRMSLGSREHYERTANWRVAVSSLLNDINNLIH